MEINDLASMHIAYIYIGHEFGAGIVQPMAGSSEAQANVLSVNEAAPGL
jgi:hypothetical protein